MKSASFKYDIPNSSRAMYGMVTLDDKDKVKISLQSPMCFSSFNRNCAKRLANDIVEANFKHSAVINFKVEELPENLVTLLTDATQTLKVQYLKFTKKYAKEFFKECELKADKWSDKEWYDKYGIEYDYIKDAGYLKVKKHDRAYYKMSAARENNYSIVNKGLDVLITKELKRAELHYEDSIIKLAHRIARLKLDHTKLQITKSHIGANLDMTITDGTLTVKAWTIVASGPIQRPHYRYLVK